MEVVIVADATEIGCVVADAVQALLAVNPCPRLGLATGGRRCRSMTAGAPLRGQPAPGDDVPRHVLTRGVADAAAAAELTLADYYQAAWAGKPAWQGL